MNPTGKSLLTEILVSFIIIDILSTTAAPALAVFSDPCSEVLSREGDPAGVVERVLIAEAELKNEEFKSGGYDRGLRLVGATIQNRVADATFWAHYDSIQGVVSHPRQYDGFSPYPPRFNKVAKRLKDFCTLAAGAKPIPIYVKAITKVKAVAREVVAQSVVDEFASRGGTYYIWTHGYPVQDWLEDLPLLLEDVTGNDFYSKK